MTDTILVVDDNLLLRKLIRQVLELQEYRVIEAADGMEALDRCFRELPDLVLLDIEMPLYNGFQVCEILKSKHETKNIPIIFLTGQTNTGDKIKGLEMGAMDYITKPFDNGEILARVKNQLRIRHLTKSLEDANEELRKKQKELEKDLIAAGQIQKTLLPDAPPNVDNASFAWRFLPCKGVGGDIFNIHRLDENHLGMYMVDVSGHGVTSAMITVSISRYLVPTTGSILKRKKSIPPYYEIVPPKKVLEILDKEYPMERFDKYFTIAYVVVNLKNGYIQYSSAGHPPPVIVRSDGQIELLDAGGSIIGMGAYVPFEGGQATIFSGDRLFLYTDGIVEFTNNDGELFGDKRFYKELISCQDLSLDEACEKLFASLRKYGNGADIQDDLSLLAMEYHPVPKASD